MSAWMLPLRGLNGALWSAPRDPKGPEMGPTWTPGEPAKKNPMGLLSDLIWGPNKAPKGLHWGSSKSL
jgi:hypothetical protein